MISDPDHGSRSEAPVGRPFPQSLNRVAHEQLSLSLECCWNVGNAGVCAVAAACTSLEALVLSGCAKLSDVALCSYPPSIPSPCDTRTPALLHACASIWHSMRRRCNTRCSVQCAAIRVASSTLVTLGPHCFVACQLGPAQHPPAQTGVEQPRSPDRRRRVFRGRGAPIGAL
jgi:hypothetical protein